MCSFLLKSRSVPIFSKKEDISDSVKLKPTSDSKSSSLESNSCSDYSFTENDIDLDSTIQIEEMCHVDTLAETFSLTQFKPFQKDVTTQCLNGNDAIVIQPTGSGKSVCYQFPAVYSGKIEIFISPTISLMIDQVKKLKERGIPCTFVGSAQHNKELNEEVLRGDI